MLPQNEQGLSYQNAAIRLGPWLPELQVDGRPAPLAGPQADAGPVTARFEVRQEAEGFQLRAILINRTDRPVTLGRATLLRAPVMDWQGPDDQAVALMWPAWIRPRVHRLDDEQCPRVGKLKVQLANLTRHTALQVGFVTFQRCDSDVRLTIDDGRLTDIEAWCDFAGWQLLPGAQTATEWLRVAAGGDAHAQLNQWADLAASHLSVRLWPEPPLGYLGWSWNYESNETCQDVALANLDAINTRLAGLGFKYLWTSMSNFEGSLPGNWLKWNHDRLPMGQEAFVEAVGRRGFKPGFWIAPFYLASSLTEKVREFDDALLRDADGRPLVVSTRWRHGEALALPVDQRPDMLALDPSHPKTQAFLREVFTTYRQWGVRYFMVDFTEAISGLMHRFPYAHHHDKSLVPGPEVYTQGMKLIKEVAGPETYLLNSTGPMFHNAGLTDGVRVGCDYGEGRAIGPASFFYPASFVINKLAFWTSAGAAINNHAAYAHVHRKLFLNDSGNVLTVDQPMPLSEARIAATIHGTTGSPTMLGDDIRHIAESRLALIRKTVPRSPHAAIALDLFTSPHPIGPRVFHRDIRLPWQHYHVVAIYNLDEHQPMPLSLDLTTLGLPADRPCHVWDFWDERYLGRHPGNAAIHVAPASVTLLRITPDPQQPALLATDLHVLMGEMEVQDATYDPADMTFHLALRRPAGDRGMAYIHAPRRYFIHDTRDLHIAKNGPDDTLVIGVPLVFDEHGRFERVIHFGLLEETPVTATTDR